MQCVGAVQLNFCTFFHPSHAADVSVILQAAARLLRNPHHQVHHLVWELVCVTMTRAAALDLLPPGYGGILLARGCAPKTAVIELLQQLRMGGTIHLHLIAALCQGVRVRKHM